MISGGRFIAGGGRLPEAWATGWGAGARAWGGELDGIFEPAGTRPANKACKSTFLGSAAAAAAAAAAADGSAALAVVGAAAVEENALESFKSGAGGDLKVSLLAIEEKSFVVEA